MKIQTSWILLIALCAALSVSGCAAVDDAIEMVNELIFGENDKGDSEGGKREYRYIPSMSAGNYAVAIDPYDGSLELIDPINKKHEYIPLSPDPVDAVVLPDNKTVVVLDGRRHEVRFADVNTLAVTGVVTVGETVNRLIAAPQGYYVLAIYDPNLGSVDYGDSGIINYYELNILFPGNGIARAVSIDFAPDNIVFTPDGSSCLLGKEFRVVHLDLETAETTAFPLSLGAQDSRTPTAMSISPDGKLAVITVAENSDVYVLDLIEGRINILDASSKAADMVFVPDTHTVILTLPDENAVAVIDLDSGIVETVEMGDTMSLVELMPGGAQAVFYSIGGAGITIMDIEDNKTKSYSLNGTIDSSSAGSPLKIDPNGLFVAVVVSGYAGGYKGDWGDDDYWGDYWDDYWNDDDDNYIDGYGNTLDLVDLGESVTVPFGLEGRVDEFRFSTEGATIGLLVSDANKLVVLNVATLKAFSRPLGRSAQSLQYMSSTGKYLVDYDHDEGKLAFADQADQENFWFAVRIFDN